MGGPWSVISEAFWPDVRRPICRCSPDANTVTTGTDPGSFGLIGRRVSKSGRLSGPSDNSKRRAGQDVVGHHHMCGCGLGVGPQIVAVHGHSRRADRLMRVLF